MKVISTIKGPIFKHLLREVIDRQDHPDGYVTATEYYLGDDLVHRSVHIEVKPIVVLQHQASL